MIFKNIYFEEHLKFNGKDKESNTGNLYKKEKAI